MTRRVLMTTDAVGGVWTYALELTAALRPHGVEVHLATMGPVPTSQQRHDADAHGAASVHTSTYALEWMEDPWSDVDRAAGWLLGLEHEIEPDVVHLNGFALAARPWRAPTTVVAHSCVYSWWDAVHGEAPPPVWARYREQVRAGLDAATAVVAPSAAMLQSLRRWYGTKGGHVIPNGRSDGWVRPAAKEPIVVGAGRAWDRAKGLDLLAASAPRLPWPVYVAGDGGGSPGPGGAHPLGRLSSAALARWLERAGIFAAPARYEPFGLGALEAGLARCALVLGDIASLREVWDDAAAYVHPGDEEHLVAVITRLARDETERSRLAEAARRRCSRYSPERMGAAYCAIYDQLGSSLPVRP